MKTCTLDELMREIESTPRWKRMWWRVSGLVRRFPSDIYYGVIYWWQRRTRGWGDDELWSLDYTIAKFVLPRLRAFRDLKQGVPWAAFRPEDIKDHEISEEGMAYAAENWRRMVDEMIFAFEFSVLDTAGQFDLDDAARTRADAGRKLFAEHFGSLWT